MFLVHYKTGASPTTRDFGHVNQFFRHAPEFRSAKEEPIFKECVEQGFIYIEQYYVNEKMITTYHRTLTELMDEVCYNRTNKR